MTRLHTLYLRVAKALRPLLIWRMRLGQSDLGDLVDGLFSRLFPGEQTAKEIRLAWGGTLWLPPGYRDSHWYTSGVLESEPETTTAFQRVLAPGNRVVDIGAHLGYYTVLASRLVGAAGHVYAFEPDPVYAGALRRNVEANDCNNVSVYDFAVGERDSEATLFAPPGGSGGSLYRRRPTVRTSVLHVRVVSLDGVFATLDWPPIDLVKLDIEGGEVFALRGMRETLRRNPGCRCIVEFELRAMRAAAVSPLELIETLMGLGFRHFSVLVNGQQQDLQLPDQMDRLIRMAKSLLYVNLLCQTTSSAG